MSRKRPEKRSLPELLKLPQDAVRGETILNFVGPQALLVENYRSILLYSDTEIRLQAKHYRLKITGTRLCIRYYDKDEMKITGRMETITFE